MLRPSKQRDPRSLHAPLASPESIAHARQGLPLDLYEWRMLRPDEMRPGDMTPWWTVRSIRVAADGVHLAILYPPRTDFEACRYGRQGIPDTRRIVDPRLRLPVALQVRRPADVSARLAMLISELETAA